VILIDTTVWIDYLRGIPTSQVEWLEGAMERQRLGLVDLILCEVLQGVRDHQHLEEVSHALSRFAIFTTGGTELALAAARNYITLRRQGYTVRKTIDCLIATFCLMHDHALLHNDRDFDPFEQFLGLPVVQT
jgi:predicted nucleic acid-binding protein